MNWNLKNAIFLGLVAVLFAIDLLVANDFMLIWSGAETFAAHQILDGTAVQFPEWLSGWFSQGDPFNTFLFRLPGILTLLGSGTAIYFIGRKVFGSANWLLVLLVAMNSLFIIQLGKLATGDVWILSFHSIGVVGMIRFLKQPGVFWRVCVYLGIILSSWINPLSTLLLFILLPTAYFLFHPQGKRVISLNPWSVVIISVLAFQFTIGLHWDSPNSILSWGRTSVGYFVGLQLIGFLPLLGFALAGIKDSIQKLRKKEELAIVVFPWLVIGLLAQTPSTQLVLAILIARHMQDYFLSGYPHGNWIKVYSVLHLIALFFGATLLMTGGFFAFKGIGFRSGLAFSAIYWMLSFLLVIGLFGNNKRQVWIGGLFSGVIASLLFWLQIFPLAQSERLSYKIIPVAPDGEGTTIYYESGLPNPEKDAVFLYLDKTQTNPVILLLNEETPDCTNCILIRPDPSNLTLDSTSISGWQDNLQWKRYQVEKK